MNCEKKPISQQGDILQIHSPLVSVIIPAYNAERFIKQTLGSVLAQTYQHFEVIVVDDGSSDRTSTIVRKIAEQDSRIQLIQQENKGVVAARNLAIQIAQGEFIAPLDADDIWLPQNLEKQVRCLAQSSSDVGLTYAWSADIDQHDQATGEFHAFTIEGQVYSTLLCHDFIGNASSVLIRHTCFEKVDSYHHQEGLSQGCEDWELYLRIAEQYQFRVVPEFLIGYRKHIHSMSCNARTMARFREAVWQSIRKKYPNLPTALYRLSNSSFYLYLARQNNLYNKPIETLYWLYQMLQIDPITPFLRLGTYLLVVKSVLSFVLQSYSPGFSSEQVGAKDNQHTQIQYQLPSIAELSDRSMAIGFKVFVGNVLHHWIPIFFGTPQSWQKNTSIQHEYFSVTP